MMNLYVQINLIAPPLYVVTTHTLERSEGLAKLGSILESIKAAIESSGGVFTVKMAVSYALTSIVFFMQKLAARWSSELLSYHNRYICSIIAHAVEYSAKDITASFNTVQYIH
jgi:esterase/lipase